MKQEDEKRIVRVLPYTSKQLSVIYGVDKRTFHKWLSRNNITIAERKGNYWSIQQVKIIFERLSLPAHIIVMP